jgi:3-deoxy-D-manno-octulosonic-acid transferase
VSVGEVLVIVDLIERIKKAFPQHRIVCSTVTKTGNKIAQEKLGHNCLVIYAPMDFSWIVRKFILMIQPKIYISTETEIWPNLYTALYRRGVPIIQINGRISDNAFKGYKRVRFLTKRVLSCVKLFYMQSPMDAERIKQIGAPGERVHVVGNLKFDIISEHGKTTKQDLGFQDTDDLLIAGSTHPGEENILIDAYKELVEDFPHLRLVIAPRHNERSDEVIKLIESKGYRAVRISRIGQSAGNARNTVIVVDTIGQLRSLYSLAKIVFIGKTLTVGGGQNMIEPAYFGKPTIVGPLTQNFKDAVSIFRKSDALIEVNDAQQLLTEARALLNNPQRAQKIGEAAQQVVRDYQGATVKTVKAISGLLEQEA